MAHCGGARTPGPQREPVPAASQSRFCARDFFARAFLPARVFFLRPPPLPPPPATHRRNLRRRCLPPPPGAAACRRRLPPAPLQMR
eukprot:gene17427-biopygen14402